MESTTTPSKKRAAVAALPRKRLSTSRSSRGPLSVPLPPEMRARLAEQAKTRGLKMATAARILLDERLRELEESDALSRAEEWQRAQAWATWEAVQKGDRRDVPMADIRSLTEQALARLDAKITPR